MRIRANVLLSIGTILATLGGARLPAVEWTLVVVGAIVLIVGGVLHRVDARKARSEGGVADTGADDEMLRSLSATLDELCERAPSLSLEALVEHLSELETGAMGQLADSIPRRLAEMGGERFAQIFGEYAAGERLVHRAWSAAADGHRPEALRSLQEGADRIRAAVSSLDGGPARSVVA